MMVGKNWLSFVIFKNLTKKLLPPSSGPFGLRNSPMTMDEKMTSWIRRLHAS